MGSKSRRTRKSVGNCEGTVQPYGENAQANNGSSPPQHFEYTVCIGRVAKGNLHVRRSFLHSILAGMLFSAALAVRLAMAAISREYGLISPGNKAATCAHRLTPL